LQPGKKVRLRDHDTGWAQTKELKELGKDVVKDRAREIPDKNLEDLAEAQALLYADDRYAVLIVLQAMDAVGKDGTIKHVMSGVNPQGLARRADLNLLRALAAELNFMAAWVRLKQAMGLLAVGPTLHSQKAPAGTPPGSG
jgi:hypothetical protein